MDKTYVCNLGAELNGKCPHRTEDGVHCTEGQGCSFCSEEDIPDKGYVRKDRWYEQYYKDSVPLKEENRRKTW